LTQIDRQVERAITALNDLAERRRKAGEVEVHDPDAAAKGG